MKITGHTYSVTIRSQLGNVSGSCHRLCGASAASPEFTQEHCVLPRPCASADSSYLNRPIVGPTPPKLPASWSSNLRHHRVVCGVSRRTSIILLYPAPYVKGISQIFRENFVEAAPWLPSTFSALRAPIYNRYGVPPESACFRRAATDTRRTFLGKSDRFSAFSLDFSRALRTVTILQVAFTAVLW